MSLMEEKIEKFNNFIISLNKENIPIGLFEGKMGVCIYLFYQSRLLNSSLYLKSAKAWLDSLHSDISKLSVSEKNINFKNGLTGICYGVIYLIENKFIKGNVNTILKDLDDTIFSYVCFTYLERDSISSSEVLENLLSCLFYFTKRLQDTLLNENEKYLFQELIIKLINTIERSIREAKVPIHFLPFEYYQPIYFCLLSSAYKLKFYNYKIENIYKTILLSTFYIIPKSESLRLLLMYSINSLKGLNLFPNEVFDMFACVKLDVHKIINQEFLNRNILPYDGLSGFYFFLKQYGLLTDEHRYEILIRIKNSELWNDFDQGNNKEKESLVGLINGLGGVILAYQDCMVTKDKHYEV